MIRFNARIFDYRISVPFCFLLLISVLQWFAPSSFNYIGGPSFGFLPFMMLFGIHLYQSISKWIYVLTYIVFQYYLNLGADFGFYPFACYLLLICFFLEIKRVVIFQVLRNLMFGYLYGYIVLERLRDDAWTNGYGLWHFSNSDIFQGLLDLPAYRTMNYFALLLEGGICILFLLQAFRIASFFAIGLHLILLFTTNITLWQLFLISYFLGAIKNKEEDLFCIKMRKIKESFQTKTSKVQS